MLAASKDGLDVSLAVSHTILLSISADFLTTVYKYHVKHNNNTVDWDTMYQYSQLTISPQEQTRALIAISSSSVKDRLLK